MRIEDCKIGQIVIANDKSNDRYSITNLDNDFKGKIVKFQGNCIAIEQINSKYHKEDNGVVWSNLDPNYFDLIEDKENKEKLDLCVERCGKKLILKYNGKVLATAKCNPNDEFDEEFGIALALTRALKKMKTTREIIITERVEDYV